ncbi:MAG: hypothetical protein IJH44_09380 [Solobacterium sp.]|nr:hypothetical protein [Solobacterium sp.]
MIKLVNVRNMDEFLNMVGQCRGDVTVHLEHYGDMHLKKHPENLELLEDLIPQNGELDISLEKPEDTALVLRSMISGKCLKN